MFAYDGGGAGILLAAIGGAGGAGGALGASYFTGAYYTGAS
jgi:hypothetical protein